MVSGLDSVATVFLHPTFSVVKEILYLRIKRVVEIRRYIRLSERIPHGRFYDQICYTTGSSGSMLEFDYSSPR